MVEHFMSNSDSGLVLRQKMTRHQPSTYKYQGRKGTRMELELGGKWRLNPFVILHLTSDNTHEPQSCTQVSLGYHGNREGHLDTDDDLALQPIKLREGICHGRWAMYLPIRIQRVELIVLTTPPGTVLQWTWCLKPDNPNVLMSRVSELQNTARSGTCYDTWRSQSVLVDNWSTPPDTDIAI